MLRSLFLVVFLATTFTSCSSISSTLSALRSGIDRTSSAVEILNKVVQENKDSISKTFDSIDAVTGDIKEFVSGDLGKTLAKMTEAVRSGTDFVEKYGKAMGEQIDKLGASIKEIDANQDGKVDWNEMLTYLLGALGVGGFFGLTKRNKTSDTLKAELSKRLDNVESAVTGSSSAL